MATKTVTANGTAQLDTAEKKFGSASALFGAQAAYLSIPNDNDFNFGSGNFTVDFWIKTATTSAPADIFDVFNIDQSATHSAANYSLEIYIDGSKHINANFSNGTNEYVASSTTDVCTNAWVHIAVTRETNTLKIWVGGTVGGTTGTISGSQVFDSDFTVEIADRFGAGGGDLTFLGWMDEIRVSKGTARWTTNFTPEAAEYTTDANTVLLLHCNGADAGTTFTDDSVAAAGPATVKTINGEPIAEVKTVLGEPIAEIKTWNGIA